jgi:hypothetical protein
MKYKAFLMFFAAICFILAGFSLSQTINQKLITTLPQSGSYNNAYSMKYDQKTGGWVFGSYDTVTSMYKLITQKGTSTEFNYAMAYNSLFDDEGNSYTIGSRSINDTTFLYAIVKNGEIAAEFNNIAEGWTIKNGVIYFSASEAGKVFLAQYDAKTGSITKGKVYDEIRLCYTPLEYSDGEPVGYVGFTAIGEPYYVAVAGDEVFLVIGDREEKHYSDISWYDVKFDKAGVPCYIAKTSGKLYSERGNTIVVHGSKEYKPFDYIYGPIEFDPSGTPVYIGQDSTGEYKYRANLMFGDQNIRTVDGSIYNLTFSPLGKLAYITSAEIPGKDGQMIYQNKLIYDGTESKSYNNVSSLQFGPNDEPMFVASDKNNKYFVVKNITTMSEKFDYIADYRILAGGVLGYVGTNYGNYDKKIPDKNFVFYGGEEYGPYDMITTSDWRTGALVISDKKGRYAFVAGKNTDFKNYYYRYKVYTNNWSSDAFDAISDLKFINGKVCFFAGNQKIPGSYIFDYSLYVNNKKLGDTYSAYSDLTVDVNGVMRFIASKGNEMYFVEAKP